MTIIADEFQLKLKRDPLPSTSFCIHVKIKDLDRDLIETFDTSEFQLVSTIRTLSIKDKEDRKSHKRERSKVLDSRRKYFNDMKTAEKKKLAKGEDKPITMSSYYEKQTSSPRKRENDERAVFPVSHGKLIIPVFPSLSHEYPRDVLFKDRLMNLNENRLESERDHEDNLTQK